MFVRRTQTRRTDGQTYYTHRLVNSERIGSKVRQHTLLNLGGHFEIPREQWPLLCQRIDEIRNGQTPLLDEAPAGARGRSPAHRRATAGPHPGIGRGIPGCRIAGARPAVGGCRFPGAGAPEKRGRRSRWGLWALSQLGLVELMAELGMNGPMPAAAVGSIVGRLAHPASERATHAWLRERSALGELLGVDFETMGAMQLYRASDALMKHRETIESHLFGRAMRLFDLEPTITLYDLTNTFYEGEAADQPKAQRGHSKEKRSDCPLLTLGLVLDGGGFVRRSRVFAGNVKEDRTLAEHALEALDAPPGSRVVLDRGIATEEQVGWLKENGYRYIVVSRERRRRFDAEAATAHRTRRGGTVHLHKVDDPDGGEVRLYCYSEERAEKERGIVERFAKRFEKDLPSPARGAFAATHAKEA